MTIGAVITTIGEPQTKACIDAVKKQNPLFDEIQIIKNVSPSAEAYNKGIKEANTKWCLFLDADMVLKENIVPLLKEQIEKKQRVLSYVFRLKDTFLRMNIKGVRLYNVKVVKKFPFQNKLGLDRICRRQAIKEGYIEIDLKKTIIGTHFDSPSDFQVYKRFLMRGVKAKKNFGGAWSRPDALLKRLKKLYNKTDNYQYLLAMRGIADGMTIDRDVDYDINFGIKEYGEARHELCK